MSWWKRNKDKEEPTDEPIDVAILTPRIREEQILIENLYAGMTLYTQGLIPYDEFKRVQLMHMSTLLKRAETHALM